jgi:P-type conjugative transfer protein TrbJ
MGVLLMKNKTWIALVLSATLGISTTAPQVFAAVPVFDATNTAENHATFLQAAQQVINSATQIANQVLELKSMPSSNLNSHSTAVNTELSQVSIIMNLAQGMMQPNQSADQMWNQVFKPINSYFSNSGNISPLVLMTNSQNMSNSLDQTLQDSLRTAKSNTDVSNDTQLLQELMNQNANAVGNKHAIQVQNDLLAQQNALYIKQNQIMAAMASAIIASNSKQNQIDAQSTAIAQKYTDEATTVMAEDPFQNARKGKW